ncbi:MAG: hypothetical protein M0Z33_02140 [Actinomycetota bacterium]|nr:hypothetical protein [Actinomycetota bacterium]
MAGQDLVVFDRFWKRCVATVVDGTPTAETPQVGPDEEWIVDAIALSASPYVPCVCALYHDSVSPANFVILSQNGGLDTFEGELVIPGGSSLLFAWSGEVGSSTLVARIHVNRAKVLTPPTDYTLATWRGPRLR